MQVEASVIFSVSVALVGVYATFNKITKENKKNNEERQEQYAREREKQTERHIEIKKTLEFIANDMSKIDSSINRIDNKVDDIDRRVTVNAEAVKSAHHRIDAVERKG